MDGVAGIYSPNDSELVNNIFWQQALCSTGARLLQVLLWVLEKAFTAGKMLEGLVI